MYGSGKDDELMVLRKHSLPNEPNSRKLASASSTRSNSSPIGSSSSDAVNSVGVRYTGPCAIAEETQLVQMSAPGSTRIRSLNHHTGDIALDIDHSTEKNTSFKDAKPMHCSKDNRAGEESHRTTSELLDPKASDTLCNLNKCLGRGGFPLLYSNFTRVIYPDNKFVHTWNRWFVVFCMVAIFVDPLFFFPMSTQPENKCIIINWTMTKTLVILRSITDFIYLLHMLLQFRVAYINPETKQFGVGDVVDEPKKIALHYLSTYFSLDLFNVLPLPQILILAVLPEFLGSSGANTAKNFLLSVILIQYIPRLIRFLPLLGGQTPNMLIFETAWANFVMNLLTYALAAHVVGSCWYLFGLQQLSTLAGNQVPSYFVWEVLFTAAIVGLGLLLFALLIGNMQNFLQALGKRRLKMSLRRLDCEQWMKIRRFPKELKQQIREAERHDWFATRGIDEEMLLNNLPEDLQRDIRHHLCEFIKNNNILCRVDKPILDSIFERLKPKSYMKGRLILDRGSLIEKVVFIVRGEMESIGGSGKLSLSKGDVCGEELLTYYLEHSQGKKDAMKSRLRGPQLKSNRRVHCLTHVDAFTLRAEDIEELIAKFSHHLGVPRATRHVDASYQPGIQRRHVQIAWRCRKRRLNRT